MKKQRKFIQLYIVLYGVLLMAGCFSAPKLKFVETKDPNIINVGEKARPVELRKIVIKLKRGQPIGAWEYGVMKCFKKGDLTWEREGGIVNFASKDLDNIFREVLEGSNYEVAGDPDNLFEDEAASQAEYVIGGLINDFKINVCYPWGPDVSPLSKAQAYLKIEWQIYSRLERKVVQKIVTEGEEDYLSGDAKPSGYLDAIYAAFEEAANNLLADKKFHKLMTSSPGGPSTTALGKKYKPITLIQKKTKHLPSSDPIADSRSKVVTIFAGDGHGSGYFISNGGHILTNAHVVGGAEFVAIRSHDGSEVVGKVVRKNRIRDTALIKIKKSTIPFSVRIRPAKVGEDVYAIGSPLEAELSSSISKGVMSGYRKENGMDLLQSDVTVLPGNSGGPLIDKNGELLGMTVSGKIFKNVPAGINFFIPIHSALESLNLKIDNQ